MSAKLLTHGIEACPLDRPLNLSTGLPPLGSDESLGAGDMGSQELKLDEAVLELVRLNEAGEAGEEGKERYVLHPLGAKVVSGLVEACLLSTLPKEKVQEQLLGVVAVCCALRNDFESPTAAKVMLEAVIQHPKAKALLAALAETGAQSSKAYRNFVDNAVQRAPSLDDEDPEDALKLKSFINVGMPLQPNAVGKKIQASQDMPKPQFSHEHPRKPQFGVSRPRTPGKHKA